MNIYLDDFLHIIIVIIIISDITNWICMPATEFHSFSKVLVAGNAQRLNIKHYIFAIKKTFMELWKRSTSSHYLFNASLAIRFRLIIKYQ